jgi:hypothetical protein
MSMVMQKLSVGDAQVLQSGRYGRCLHIRRTVMQLKCHSFYPFTCQSGYQRNIVSYYESSSRSQRARDLRRELSSPAQTLGSWVRIPPETWMSVCVYSVCVVMCVGSGLQTGLSLVKGVLPTVYIRIKKLIKRPKSNKGL